MKICPLLFLSKMLHISLSKRKQTKLKTRDKGISSYDKLRPMLFPFKMR